MHTEGGGEKMEQKRPVEEDEVEEDSLGPKRWSKFMVDEEEEPPACFDGSSIRRRYLKFQSVQMKGNEKKMKFGLCGE